MGKGEDRCYATPVAKSTVGCASSCPQQLHRYGELHFALSLTDRAIKAAILPYTEPLYQEDSTLSQRTVGMPEFNELMDMARLLVNLWEAAQRLPEGSERRDALRQISGFQSRVAALVTRTF
jgi:hypothetical protein